MTSPLVPTYPIHDQAIPTCLRLGFFMAVLACLHLVPITATAGQPAVRKYEVQSARGITYYEVANDPDAARHQLDVYRPSKKGTYPVLLFLHGGAWMFAGKDDFFGVYGYGTIARCLAEQGLVVILPNYRLSPRVQHPAHIQDAARAFAWTVQHCEEYGGDRTNIFIGGHSAGGHLAALLATDESYLKEVGCTAKDIRGVIGLSGVYQLKEFEMKWIVAGSNGIFRNQLEIKPLAVVFGDDPEVIQQASPIHHVRKGLPPFLIVTGGWDYAPMRRMAQDFADALKEKGVSVHRRTIAWRSHETLVFDIVNLTADAATIEAVRQFIEVTKVEENKR